MTQPAPPTRPLSLPLAIGLGAVAILTPLILVLAVLGNQAAPDGGEALIDPPAEESLDVAEEPDPDL